MEIKAPVFPESIADGEVASWHVAEGQWVSRDEILVDIETDKVVLEVVAPAPGRITKIVKTTGETVLSEALLAEFEAGEGEAISVPSDSTEMAADAGDSSMSGSEVNRPMPVASPAARKLAEESGVDLRGIQGSGKSGLVTKEDILSAVAKAQDIGVPPGDPANQTQSQAAMVETGERIERRVPMTRLRASIAKRLVDAQQTAAMLTTFNEVDMSAIMSLRAQYKEAFEKAHSGTRLGFMSFFVRACTEALKRFPAVNASIDGNDIVYHGYQDVGVAVSSPRGLVVPVIRDADSLTLAEVEEQIKIFGEKAQNAQLSIEDMTGGTFTISNGGVFGSMLSTPILNPPQTAILGMHKIQDRPMAIDGQVVVRPMMYLALSYDHRLIDGQEAVRFLVTVKDFLEEPARILLDI
ncbi:MAG: 2-oxoglutarate dehydrogenase complex dihydrolipoyllysine-residue succinyltransferase [Pseudomonadales bacterium]|jgi:2-oxoglutarate dehydrogenase E2 component (dihydrolipoamide succinyltransferase)|nr:2-oxoglutarate dehydrogenase complex dihydrolipoyllysine-residue succinyltransferase [Pseudomonadales bacterium]MDA0761736.1 2-oxoglutarate dehydrogenase complex dihydrolipoyllysine-residue succinyltransferase [Pseudomonadota bacterium]MDA0958199.1 2-oxoglutarate dehydrogenase complex dihydrolipoyllysine-residue succinyltransferase [Pseudomonadota bacterium]